MKMFDKKLLKLGQKKEIAQSGSPVKMESI
jgi:hypothetical protein